MEVQGGESAPPVARVSGVDADASGNGPISAFLAVLGAEGVHVKLRDYVEHTLAASGDAVAAAYVELEVEGRVLWGVGIDADISTASLKAVVSAVNRALRAARVREEAQAPALA